MPPYSHKERRYKSQLEKYPVLIFIETGMYLSLYVLSTYSFNYEILGISVGGGRTIIRSNGIETVCQQKNLSH